MSWGEVKKINDDMNTPLNHLLWLNDYKMYGEDSYVYQDKDIWDKLIKAPCAVNDIMTQNMILQYYIDNELKLGDFLSQISELRNRTINYSEIDKLYDLTYSTEIFMDFIQTTFGSNILINNFGFRETMASNLIKDLNDNPDYLDIVINILQNDIKTATSSYTEPCIFISGVSNIASNSGDVIGTYDRTTYYVFAKGGLSYYTKFDDTTVTLTSGGTASGSYLNVAGTSTGTTSQPYSTTTYTVQKIVDMVTISPKTIKNQVSCTAGCSITYIPLTAS